MKVSVCLASYNGEAFLKQQLESILADLDEGDELIVADDASCDRTIAITQGIADQRIKLHAFTDNVGHVRNFERALGAATGDVIFLSDQDDIWVRGKRNRVVDEFIKHPDLAMIVHALKLIDPGGRDIVSQSGSWRAPTTGRQPTVFFFIRQFFKNQVTGCATAFSSKLLKLILPFPSVVYAHDHWLSVAAPFVGKVIFLNEALVEYRQHADNLTPKDGLSLNDRLKVRAKLFALFTIGAARAFNGSKSSLKG